MRVKWNTKTEIVKCRVTAEELAEIDERVDALGTTRSDYLRRLILDKDIVVYDFSGLDELTYQIGKIGVNINQIARKLNQGGNLDKENAEYLLAAMSVIHESVKKIYKDAMNKKAEVL